MAKPELVATVYVSVIVSCPTCDEIVDLSESKHDTEGDLVRWVTTNDWDRAKGFEFECPACDGEFQVEKLEY